MVFITILYYLSLEMTSETRISTPYLFDMFDHVELPIHAIPGLK
jgi:hypothetical protein